MRKKNNEAQSKAAKSLFSQGLYNEKEPAITKAEQALPPFEKSNPQTFMDIEIGEPATEQYAKGRVVFELFE